MGVLKKSMGLLKVHPQAAHDPGEEQDTATTHKTKMEIAAATIQFDIEVDDPPTERNTLALKERSDKHSIIDPNRRAIISKPVQRLKEEQNRSSILTRPFKSPMRKLDTLSNVSSELPSSSQTYYDEIPTSDATLMSSPGPVSTPRKAQKPFKPPVGGDKSSISILDVQTLERKIQILKRAIKIVKEEDDDTLEILTAKWREKGREVASQLCTEITKNNWGETSTQYTGVQVSSSLSSWLSTKTAQNPESISLFVSRRRGIQRREGG